MSVKRTTAVHTGEKKDGEGDRDSQTTEKATTVSSSSSFIMDLSMLLLVSSMQSMNGCNHYHVNGLQYSHHPSHNSISNSTNQSLPFKRIFNTVDSYYLAVSLAVNHLI